MSITEMCLLITHNILLLAVVEDVGALQYQPDTNFYELFN